MFDTSPRRRGPLPVWPYYFSAALTAVIGLGMVWFWSPEDFPTKDALVKINGDIATVRIRDDISDSSAGAMMTAFTSVYFTFTDGAGEYYYPSTQPDFLLVRDYTAVNIDIWIEGAKRGSGAPIRIWQIVENNPSNLMADPTNVTYEMIIDRLITVDRSMVIAGRWLLVFGLGLVLIGRGIQAGNGRRFRDWA